MPAGVLVLRMSGGSEGMSLGTALLSRWSFWTNASKASTISMPSWTVAPEWPPIWPQLAPVWPPALVCDKRSASKSKCLMSDGSDNSFLTKSVFRASSMNSSADRLLCSAIECPSDGHKDIQFGSRSVPPVRRESEWQQLFADWSPIGSLWLTISHFVA